MSKLGRIINKGVLAQRAALEGWGGSGQVPSLLAERAR